MTAAEMTALLNRVEHTDQLMEDLRNIQDEQALEEILHRHQPIW